MQIRYRLYQFGRALTGRISADEQRTVAATLAPAERHLFKQMAPFDQRHCLDVYATLVAAGHVDATLLQAALLHDCGKVSDDGRTIPLFYYGLFVILQRGAPALYERAAQSERGLLWPFAVHSAHEVRSAQRVVTAGATPQLVALLRAYAAHHATPQTEALRWADEQN